MPTPKFERLNELSVPPPREEARARAVATALQAFEEAQNRSATVLLFHRIVQKPLMPVLAIAASLAVVTIGLALTPKLLKSSPAQPDMVSELPTDRSVASRQATVQVKPPPASAPPAPTGPPRQVALLPQPAKVKVAVPPSSGGASLSARQKKQRWMREFARIQRTAPGGMEK